MPAADTCVRSAYDIMQQLDVNACRLGLWRVGKKEISNFYYAGVLGT